MKPTTSIAVHLLILLVSVEQTACFQPSPTQSPLSHHELISLHVAVLGGGNVGSILAHRLIESKQFASVKIAARDITKTTFEIEDKGYTNVPVQTSSEALSSSNVVILATPGLYDDHDIHKFATSMGNDMVDKIIIDATNPLESFADGLNVFTWESGTSSAEKLQNCLPKARVYKTFNTIGFEHMGNANGKDMLIAGDPDASSREIVEGVVAAAGFTPFFVGPIQYARNLEAMAELWIHMAIPGLGGRDTSRDFWFSISGDPYGGGTRE